MKKLFYVIFALVVLIGAAAAVVLNVPAAQACIAVVTNEHSFLFDVGARSPQRMDQARLPMARINGVILTHFHSDHIDYHADVTSLPARAAKAGIKQLALYHLVPAPPNALIERMFLRGLPDDIILTRDLHTFDLPADSHEIRITEP